MPLILNTPEQKGCLFARTRLEVHRDPFVFLDFRAVGACAPLPGSSLGSVLDLPRTSVFGFTLQLSAPGLTPGSAREIALFCAQNNI